MGIRYQNLAAQSKANYHVNQWHLKNKTGVVKVSQMPQD